MIKIAVCDDVQQDQQLLVSLIRELNPFDGQFVLDQFGSGEAFLT